MDGQLVQEGLVEFARMQMRIHMQAQHMPYSEVVPILLADMQQRGLEGGQVERGTSVVVPKHTHTPRFSVRVDVLTYSGEDGSRHELKALVVLELEPDVVSAAEQGGRARVDAIMHACGEAAREAARMGRAQQRRRAAATDRMVAEQVALKLAQEAA